MYNPQMGAWLQRDPHGSQTPLPSDGHHPGLGQTQPSVNPAVQYEDGLNLYPYVVSNPCTLVDPLGLYNEDVHEDLTYQILKWAGFKEDAAIKVALADQYQDSITAPERRAPQLRLHTGNARDWSVANCFWGNCLFWDNAVAELWHLPRVGGPKAGSIRTAISHEYCWRLQYKDTRS